MGSDRYQCFYAACCEASHGLPLSVLASRAHFARGRGIVTARHPGARFGRGRQGATLAHAQEAAPVSLDVRIRQLIEQLGAEQYATRGTGAIQANSNAWADRVLMRLQPVQNHEDIANRARAQYRVRSSRSIGAHEDDPSEVKRHSAAAIARKKEKQARR